MSVEDGLHSLEKLGRYDGWMRGLVALAAPVEEAEVKLVSQDAVMNVALGDELAGFFADEMPEIRKGVIAGSVQFEHAFCDFGIFRMQLNGVIQLVIAIAQRRPARVDALRGFFPHPFLDLFGQILNVIPGDNQLNAVHQFGLRLRILADDLSFLGKMDFDAQVFQGDTIAEVTVETVGFLYNDHAAKRILFEKADHFAKLLSTGGLGGFDINELAQQPKAVLGSIFP